MGVTQHFTFRAKISRDAESGYDDYGNRVAPDRVVITEDAPCYLWMKDSRRYDTQQDTIVNEITTNVLFHQGEDVQSQDHIEVFDRRGRRICEEMVVDGRPKSIRRYNGMPYKLARLVEYDGVQF